MATQSNTAKGRVRIGVCGPGLLPGTGLFFRERGCCQVRSFDQCTDLFGSFAGEAVDDFTIRTDQVA